MIQLLSHNHTTLHLSQSIQFQRRHQTTRIPNQLQSPINPSPTNLLMKLTPIVRAMTTIMIKLNIQKSLYLTVKVAVHT